MAEIVVKKILPLATAVFFILNFNNCGEVHLAKRFWNLPSAHEFPNPAKKSMFQRGYLLTTQSALPFTKPYYYFGVATLNFIEYDFKTNQPLSKVAFPSEISAFFNQGSAVTLVVASEDADSIFASAIIYNTSSLADAEGQKWFNSFLIFKYKKNSKQIVTIKTISYQNRYMNSPLVVPDCSGDGRPDYFIGESCYSSVDG